MAEIEFKSNKLKNYINRLLEKEDNDTITENDLENITSLKIDKNILQDLSMGDLIFFKQLKSLSLSNIDISNNEIALINRLDSIETLAINNATIDIDENTSLSVGLKNLVFVNCDGLDIKQFNKNKNLTKISLINCKNAKLDGISELENLEEANLPNNEWMKNEDIQDLWNSTNIKTVNLDGNTNLTDIKHENIQVSHNQEYRPGEKIDWDQTSRQAQGINFNANYIKTPEGKEKIAELENQEPITITLDDTSKLSIEELKELSEKHNINRIFVNTGWKATQNKGYSINTFLAIKEKMAEITGNIDSNASEQDRYLQVRERITNKIRYDYSVLSADSNDKDYYASRNLENGLLNNTCVCAGYADIMRNALAEVGIEAKYVEGMTNHNELHAWIQVKIDGKWYNDDITWDAINVSSGKNGYKYCMMNDAEFSKTHKYAIPLRTEGFGVNECNANIPENIILYRKGTQTNTVFANKSNIDFER